MFSEVSEGPDILVKAYLFAVPEDGGVKSFLSQSLSGVECALELSEAAIMLSV